MKNTNYITGYLVAVLILPIVSFIYRKFKTLNTNLRRWVSGTEYGAWQLKQCEDILTNGGNPF